MLISVSLLCVSKEEDETHFTQKTMQKPPLQIRSYSEDTSFNACLCACLGQVILPLHSSASLSAKIGNQNFPSP